MCLDSLSPIDLIAFSCTDANENEDSINDLDDKSDSWVAVKTNNGRVLKNICKYVSRLASLLSQPNRYIGIFFPGSRNHSNVTAAKHMELVKVCGSTQSNVTTPQLLPLKLKKFYKAKMVRLMD